MKNTNLLLHCGAAKVERDWLGLIATPKATDTWFPIPHERLVREVETALWRVNMRVANQAHGLSPDGCRYFGLLQIVPVTVGWNSPQPPTGDYTYVLGLRNSHDKRFPPRWFWVARFSSAITSRFRARSKLPASTPGSSSATFLPSSPKAPANWQNAGTTRTSGLPPTSRPNSLRAKRRTT